MRVAVTLIFSLFLSGMTAAAEQEQTRLLRFPDIHKEQVTFVYAGDIYLATLTNPEAKRLTSGVGLELFPKFSPDGSRIAFSAEYSGSRQIYVMDTDGSNLKQLTWYNDVGSMPPRGGFDYRVMDWTPDGKQVLVRANRLPWGERMGRPYLVPVDGGMEAPLAVPETGGGMLSPDGTRYVYTPIDREFRTWKRYRGGRAQDVWIYNLEQNSSERLTKHRATDNQPLWVKEDIFFTSDREYTLNLYRYVADAEPVKVTSHGEFDVLWPSAGPEAVVYENGGYLYRYDPAGSSSEQLPIKVNGNRNHLIPHFKSVAGNIESMDISPDGKRVVLGARGEIFTVPAKHGEIRHLSQSSSAREMNVSWSPDGRYIAYLSDASGEYEVYIRDQSGNGAPRQITKEGAIWRFAPVWSPDSKKLAFADKNQTLWSVEVKRGNMVRVDRSSYDDVTHYAWSPDSQWLTYAKSNANNLSAVWVYNLKSKKATQLTGDTSSDYAPVFDPAGRYLYFISDRDFNLSFSSYEFNYLYSDSARVYAAQLNASADPLYPPQSDEVSLGEKEGKNSDKKSKEKPVAVNIDFDGFMDRVIALPGKAGGYDNLQANRDAVFVLNDGEKPTLLRIDLKESKDPEKVAEGISDYRLAAKGEKLLVHAGKHYAIIDAKAAQNVDENKLNLDRLQVRIDPKQEWEQLYTDAWRVFRDWFYDPATHGTDWNAIRARYQPMADAVTHRADLDYVLGEVGGELNAGHVYVQSGDQPKVKRIEGGLLGAEIVPGNDGYFRISKIFAGENWHESSRSPLTQPGVRASEGDYILAVNGVSAKTVTNFYQLMENTVGRTVTLTLNSQPKQRGAWQAEVKPIASEGNLRYLNWVASRAAMVDKLSGGRVGYIHLPNTATEGNRELVKHFIHQANKDALIIDDRYNGGGFIPDRMIELLSRKTLNYWKWRGLAPEPTPAYAHDGPKVMLVNGYSSSGGDALPFYFRKLGLGKLIGTRTWGGLIGISYNPPLIDGGSVLPSNFRILDTTGKWVVENEGVEPDIEVIDRPELVAQGRDPTLERAVVELLKELEENPRKRIKAPQPPSEF